MTPDNHRSETVSAKIQQWDGKQWVALTDWLTADPALFKDILYGKAEAYAKEKGITPAATAATN